MTKVNWVENDDYREVQSDALLAYFKQVWNSGKRVFIYDPEVSDDQPDEYLFPPLKKTIKVIASVKKTALR